MKINKILILFVLIGAILAAGYYVKITTNTPGVNATVPVTPTQGIPVPVITENVLPTGTGEALVSIGEYNDNLTVRVDNINSGNVSNGVPLSLSLPGGSHTIKVCSETFCESVVQDIQASIKTTVDFGQRLSENHPEGFLKISLGDYDGMENVSVDNSSRGTVTTTYPLVLTVGPGTHVVKICPTSVCFTKNAIVSSYNQTLVDFGPQLKNGVKQAAITITIGGYKATLPVMIDNKPVGNVSYLKALTARTTEGVHEVKVCSGVICEKQIVDLRFAKPTTIDFGDQLKRDVEFPDPTVRIIDSSASGGDMSIDVEFINPSAKDLAMTATISVAYTYLDYSSLVRTGASKTAHLTSNVTAGERNTEYLYMYLSGGDSVTASAPVVISVTTK